jgi:hypothetical protein
MALVMLTDVILLGHEKVGTRSLGNTKVDILTIALSSLADLVCDTWTRHAIPRLGLLNGWNMEMCPALTHSTIASPDVEKLAALLDSLAKAGVDVFPDDDLKRQIYSIAGLTTAGIDKAMEEERHAPEPPQPPEPPREPEGEEPAPPDKGENGQAAQE